MASPSAALRSTFLDVLSKLLAPDVNERRLAEQHLDALAVTEGTVLRMPVKSLEVCCSVQRVLQ